MEKVESLSQNQRDHMRIVVEKLVQCYLDPELHAVLVIGNERLGLEPEVLERLDRVAEIPLAGMPHSLNAATSAAIAVYEYCRQFPGPAGGAGT
jgi:tRNA G18 (ribose-2'-O)-methylase SpoU